MSPIKTKQPVHATSSGSGASMMIGKVMGINGNVAQVMMHLGQKVVSVRTDILRAKGVAPQVGEDWVFDQMFGTGWNFAAILSYPGTEPDIAAGGTTGQALVKASNDDYDTTWTNLSGGGGVPLTRRVNTTAPLTGGGDLTADRTLAVTTGTAAGTVAAGNDARLTGAVQGTRQVATSPPLTGGGDLTADRTLGVSVGTGAGTVAAGNDSRITGAVQNTRAINTTAPLTGGGALSADRTLGISVGTTAGTVAAGNDSRFAGTLPGSGLVDQILGMVTGSAPQWSSGFAPIDNKFGTSNWTPPTGDTLLSDPIYPLGTSLMALSTGQGSAGAWPVATTASVFTTKFPGTALDAGTGWARGWQIWVRNSIASPQMYFRSASTGAWSAWQRLDNPTIWNAQMSVTINGVNNANKAITWPAGMFAAAPICSAMCDQGNSVPWVANVSSITATGGTLAVRSLAGINGGTTPMTVSVIAMDAL